MGDNIQVNISPREKSKLKASLSQYAKKVGLTLDKTIEAIAFEIDLEAKRIVPVKDGALEKSIKPEKVKQNHWIVGTNSGYGLYIEFGEPIGTGPNGGPKPFLRPSYEKVKKKVNKVLEGQIDRIK